MRLSIVTLSFNQVAHISQAIESVAAVFPDAQHIVVDPGSTDGSRELLARRLPAADLVMEPDRGPADGLNKGFAIASGELLAYLNADDLYPGGAADGLLDVFTAASAPDVLVTAVDLVDAAGSRLQRLRPTPFTARGYAFGRVYAPQQGTFLTRRALELAGGFNVDNRTCWDAELLVDVALAGGIIATQSTVRGCFRLHKGSITGSQVMRKQYERDQDRIFAKVVGRPPHALDRLAIRAGGAFRYASTPTALGDRIRGSWQRAM